MRVHKNIQLRATCEQTTETDYHPMVLLLSVDALYYTLSRRALVGKMESSYVDALAQFGSSVMDGVVRGMRHVVCSDSGRPYYFYIPN